MKSSKFSVSKFSTTDVAHIARLANIPVDDQEIKKLAVGFTSTMSVVNEIFAVNVRDIEPTHQVTDLENIWREDEIDIRRMFSQKMALSNAKCTYNGYFVVDAVFNE